MSKDAIEVKDELLTVYKAAAADDSFVPAPRVKSAVMMYARTLAEHRNAFPGSVAHENAAEETELASVPRDNKTLDPRPLPIKPLSSDDENEGTEWPRDLPPVVQGSAWQSLGKWVAAATAGGLALGASYSWFNASRQHSAAPEPMIAQAPAAAPVVVVPPVAVAPPVTAAPPLVVATAEPPAARVEANEASPRREAADAAAPRAKAELAKPAAVKKAAPKNNEAKLAKAPNATSNPPVAVADGKPVAAPQISAAPLPNNVGSASGAVAAGPAPAEAVAMNDAASTDSKAKRAASPQAGAASMSTMEARASGADGRANTADARVSAALGRPEHEAVPEKWMAYITDLKNRGRTREADIELVRLRERYPQFNIGKPTKFIDKPMNKPTDNPVDAPSPIYTPTTPPSQPR
jgi:hypothetical protein